MAGRFLLFCACSLLTVNAHSLEAQDSATTGVISVLKGIYTDDQARKGESTYGKFCLSCHDATEHAGAVFEDAWAGRPVYEFFVKIKTTMPDDEPGALKDQEYTDIVAYMLKLTGYPSGAAALPNDAEKMRGFLIERLPKPDSGVSLARRGTVLTRCACFPHASGTNR
ncbi:MAG: hypothetical protein MNPFHGCM_00027 [Gemmatimonadaceae bacterium]|nr:hypothetical protein [Gemmatimonadaceae bacterium]